MIPAKNGHMCLNCGYAESADPHKTPLVPGDSPAPKVVPEPTVAVSTEPAAPAAEPEPIVVEPTDKAENSLEDRIKLDVAEAVAAVPSLGGSEIIKTSGVPKTDDKPVDSMAPRGRTKGTLDLKPSREDPVKGAAAVSTVDAISPALAAPDKAVEEATPVHVVDHAAEAAEVVIAPEVTAAEPVPTPSVVAPTPPPVPEVHDAPVPAAEPVVTSNIPAAPTAKEPLIAKTHPQASSAKTVMMVVGALVIVTCATLAAYYFTTSKSSDKVSQNESATKQSSADAADESVAVLDNSATPTPTPTATPVATPDAASAQARDLKRKTDLAAYAAVVKAAATNGYYPTAAPAVSGTALDPTTGKSYAVATTLAANLGSIRYLAGGKCTAPSVTPGKTSTRFIALYTKLETDSAPYCLDVK